MFKLTLSNVFIAVSLVASARATCVHGTTLMRREEGEIPAPTFSYGGDTGPLNWGGLNENNTACATGTTQSPIVLTNEIPFATSAPKWDLPAVNEAEFENLSTTLEVFLEGSLDFEGQVYKLKQFHMHTPCEHRFNDEFCPLEVHFVHQAESGDLTVVGVPFEISEDGKIEDWLKGTVKNLAKVEKPLTKTKTGRLDFGPLIAAVQTQNLYHYKGSLTTPPCAEGVQFLILEAPMALDVKTFNALKKIMKFNARYTQNAPGKENLLAIAKGQSGESTDGSTEGSVDVDALMQAFLASGKKMSYETVTKTETIVKLVDEEPQAEDPPTTEPAKPDEPAETTNTEGSLETQVEHAPGPAAPPASRRRSNLGRRHRA